MAIDGIGGNYYVSGGQMRKAAKTQGQEVSGASIFPQKAKDNGQTYTNMSAGMHFVGTDQQGNKIEIKYNDSGTEYTEKHYNGNSDKLYFTTTYDANTKKIIKKADYDFISGKLYQEQIFTDNGRIERHYDDDGSFSGEHRITNGKNGSAKIEYYDSYGKKTGYTEQKKIGKDERGRDIYERKHFDEKGKLTEIETSSYPIDGEILRRG